MPLYLCVSLFSSENEIILKAKHFFFPMLVYAVTLPAGMGSMEVCVNGETIMLLKRPSLRLMDVRVPFCQVPCTLTESGV